MSNRKNLCTDVFDTIANQSDSFRSKVISGRIYPKPDLKPEVSDDVSVIVVRLKQDSLGCKKVGDRHFSVYTQQRHADVVLKQSSSFVWSEATVKDCYETD